MMIDTADVCVCDVCVMMATEMCEMYVSNWHREELLKQKNMDKGDWKELNSRETQSSGRKETKFQYKVRVVKRVQ